MNVKWFAICFWFTALAVVFAVGAADHRLHFEAVRTTFALPPEPWMAYPYGLLVSVGSATLGLISFARLVLREEIPTHDKRRN